MFHSFRLVLGEVGRSVAAYAGPGVYLDVALGWVAGRVATAPVELRDEGADRRSGYSLRSLLSHFWRMVLTGGTRGLRLVSVLGLVFAVLGTAAGGLRRLPPAGRSRADRGLDVVDRGDPDLHRRHPVLLGVIAEYVGVAVNMAMGKPLYLITQDPADGPLGRPDRRP